VPTPEVIVDPFSDACRSLDGIPCQPPNASSAGTHHLPEASFTTTHFLAYDRSGGAPSGASMPAAGSRTMASCAASQRFAPSGVISALGATANP
jgi:hypothetical protein